LEEFRGYIGIYLLMGLKKLPSHRLYWSRDEPLFRCPLISQLMMRDRYELITRCLHVANAPADVSDPSSANYDKLHKVRWMLNEVQGRFKAMWSPNQQMTVKVGMIMCKGKYYPIRQYMPKKPIRFGLKFWAAADALSKYLWDFEVYCGKGGISMTMTVYPTLQYVLQRRDQGKGFSGHNIVKDLMKDLVGRGHIVTTDNYFTSVPLFLDLLESGTMATGTLRANRKYVPRAMFAKNLLRNRKLGGWTTKCTRKGKFVVRFGKTNNQYFSTHVKPVPP
jgi:hypothetical protein